MKQIQMNKSKNLSVNDAYDLFIRKCRVKNLSQASIVSYENKIQPFVDYCDGGLISAVTIDTVDGFTNHLKTEHNVNDVSVVSYLRSVRAFLYYCMECNYMTTFKIHLPKADKAIKEIYTDEQLEKLLEKPDTNNKERAMTIADKLKAKGLPSELAQYLNLGEDIDGSIDKVGDTLCNYFLGQVSNPSGNHATNKSITKADFAKMSYAERAKLFQENNELYKALSK